MRIPAIALLATSLAFADAANAQSLVDCRIEGARVQIYMLNPSGTNLACTWQCLLFDSRGVLKQSIRTIAPTVIEQYSSSISVNASNAPDGVAFRTVSAKCKPTTDGATSEADQQSTIEVENHP
jgi:hypothetical protein